MKRCLQILLAALMPAIAAAQAPNFTISGHIGHLNAPAKVYLNYMTGTKDNSDSATLVNGYFKFTGYVKPYSSARMALDHKGLGRDVATHGGDVIYFHFSGENFTITSNDSLSNAKITGSKTYDEYADYVKAVGPMPWDIDKISNAELASAPELSGDTAFTNKVARHHYQMINDFQTKNFQFAGEHPQSYFAPVALFGTASSEKTVEDAEKVFKTMSPEVQATEAGQAIQAFISAHYRIKPGSIAPDFTQADVSEKPVKLSQFRGKIVLLDFWASWCSPCRQEIPNITKQYKMYKDKGFEIVSISLDNNKPRWTNAI